ncbi:MAG: hypothetical protein JWM95_1717 [Gemmatimonadetes bacterium]|nr:hypothetical protein [Gemmatimonadota bacterium]
MTRDDLDTIGTPAPPAVTGRIGLGLINRAPVHSDNFFSLFQWSS